MESISGRWIVATGISAALAGCGGGGSSSGNSTSTSAPVTNASPGGIWRGTDSATGRQVTGLIDEAGEFHFLQSDNVQYVGTATVTANSISANFEGFTQIGTAFADGSTHGTGSVSGTVQARTSMSLNTTFTTDKGASTSGTLSMTFDTLYNRSSALATVSGNYSNGSAIVSVDSTGAIFSQDPNTGCVVNGTVSIIDSGYNAYRVSYSYASCMGQLSVLNGLQFSGLATLDNTQTPEHVVVGVTATSGSTKYAVVLNLPRG